MKKISTTLLLFVCFLSVKGQVSYTETFGTTAVSNLDTYAGNSIPALPAGSHDEQSGTIQIVTTAPTSPDGGAYIALKGTLFSTSNYTISNIPTGGQSSVVVSFYYSHTPGTFGFDQCEVQYSTNTSAPFTYNTLITPATLSALPQAWTYVVSAPITVTPGQVIRIRFASTYSTPTYRIDLLRVGSLDALPLVSRNFTAAPVGNQVKLDWTGVATHLNSYFEVERSNNGREGFRKLGTVPVTAIGEAKYRFMDSEPLKPEAYYRIRIIDENQRVSYTKTLKVTLGGKHFALDNLFPTVATSQLNLLISSSKAQQTRVEIIDQNGRIAVAQNLTVNSGSQSYQLNVSNLSKGFYILRLRNGDEVVSSRFIKQ